MGAKSGPHHLMSGPKPIQPDEASKVAAGSHDFATSKGYGSKAGHESYIRKRDLKMDEKLQELIKKEAKMTVNDFLNEREIKLANRNSILQSSQFNFLRVLQLGYERSKTSDTP